MDTQEITVVVPGPLHPDLFGGLTPIMTPVTVRAFEVGVSWLTRDEVRHYRTFTVLRSDEGDAEVSAEERAAGAFADMEGLSVDEVEELGAGAAIDEKAIADYRKYYERANARSVCSVSGRG